MNSDYFRLLASKCIKIKRLVEKYQPESSDGEYTEPYTGSIAMTAIAVLALLFSIPFLTANRSGQQSNKTPADSDTQSAQYLTPNKSSDQYIPSEVQLNNIADSNSTNLQAANISGNNEEKNKEPNEKQRASQSEVVTANSDSSAMRELPQTMVPGEILKHANRDIDAQRFTSPKGNNAWERYKLVMLLDPGNPVAQQGLQKLFVNQIELAKQAEARGQSELATKYLITAENVLFGEPVLETSQTMANSQAHRIRQAHSWETQR